MHDASGAPQVPDESTDGRTGESADYGPADGETAADETADGEPLDVTGATPSSAQAPAVSAREAAALRRARRVSRLLDEAVRIPGTDVRIGLDPVLGLLPVGGDAVAALLSLYPAVEAYRLGAARGTIARMLALVAVDAIVGSIPVVGTVFDAFWTANTWNVRALERHVREA